MVTKLERYRLRKQRVRRKLLSSGYKYPRLCVYRSLKYLYAQVVDDSRSETFAFATTLSKELKGKFVGSAKGVEAARALGELIAQKALDAGIKRVCFDRGGRAYHGRIKALASAARRKGLEF
jgi:large subunit ribosomal protein L18